MPTPTSVKDIDLSPLPNKTYFDSAREWREEFIYFLLVDRFHDGKQRTPVASANRSAGGGTFDQLGGVCGGTLNGITKNLDYIAGLGCTALWLSPVFENNPQDGGTYHGYAVQNYLNVDPRFGTKEDLVRLVDQAHQRDMRVFLDVVVNHSGDLWKYDAADNPWFYSGQRFDLHSFRRPDRPVPTELRDKRFFHRFGQIRNWDAFPEFERGDFFGLKDWAHDNNADGCDLMDILVAAHSYWIREADVDGFRMDAVKHLGPVASARFATACREYAYRLGKRSFMTFGELIAGDDSINRFIGPNTAVIEGQDGLFFGIDSVLDFPLNFVLPGAIKGLSSPAAVFSRYDAMRDRALNRGELGQFLVTFLDNHDNVDQDPFKHRFPFGAPDEQVIAGVGFLLCALGIACIYYGTEQGFAGNGKNDRLIRETMFDLADPSRDFLNTNCGIYQEIAKIAAIHRTNPALRFGRMYMRDISGNGRDFGRPQGHPCTLAFSRMLSDQEVVVAYNTSTSDERNDFVCVDARLQRDRANFKFVSGGSGMVPVHRHPDPNNPTRALQLKLKPMQFAVLAQA
jgi:alpha-amylase